MINRGTEVGVGDLAQREDGLDAGARVGKIGAW